MVFSSMTFLFAFLPIVLLLYYVMPKRWKNLILMCSGVFFYAWGEPFYVFLMLFTILIDYGAGLLMNRLDAQPKKKLAVLLVSVVLNLGFLGVFKYGSFVVENINALFGAHLFDPELPLPIGISFYTFQAMSYTIDLYRKKIRVQKNIINFTAYVTMFPQLIAGPIVLYSDVENEIDDRRIGVSELSDGIGIFITGLAKKVLLANNIGALWTMVKGMDASTLPAMTAWLGILAFTFQIYYDFSGYSDMAVGMGKMLGFQFPQNFNYPYLSRSITEFWRRWHMTLGNWFKSYVYIPLGGNRCGIPRNICNLLIVWFLTGLWHGASWNFVFWGVYFGVLLIGEKFVWGKWLEKLPSFFRWLYAFVLVVFGWVLFEMTDLQSIGGFFAAMFGLNGAGFANSQTLYLLLSYLFLFLLAAVGSTRLVQKFRVFLEKKQAALCNGGRTVCVLAIFIICICYMVTSSYNPFLYFNF